MDAVALQRRVEQLERDLAKLRAQLDARPLAFDAPAPAGITITERKRYEFAAELARPRVVVGFTAVNTTTGAAIACNTYSAAQLERFALRFARLASPTRAAWRGDRGAFGIMRDLFAQHGAIVRDHGRAWRWAAWPAERRAIALRIAAAAKR